MRRTIVIVAAAIVALLVLPAPALAQPNRVTLFDLRVVPRQDGGREMLIGVELAPNVPLPAQVRLPVERGAQIDWAGEVLGGNPSADPRAAYQTEQAGEYDTIVFTLKQARRGQVEYGLSSNASSSGTLKIDWRAPADADSAQLLVVLPRGARGDRVSPGATPTTGTDGSVAYLKSFDAPKKNQRLQLSVRYSGGSAQTSQPQLPGAQPNQQLPSAQSQSAQPPPSGRTPAPLGVAVLVLGAILGVTFYLLQRVGQAAEGPGAAKPAATGPNPAAAKRSKGKTRK